MNLSKPKLAQMDEHLKHEGNRALMFGLLALHRLDIKPSGWASDPAILKYVTERIIKYPLPTKEQVFMSTDMWLQVNDKMADAEAKAIAAKAEAEFLRHHNPIDGQHRRQP